MIGGNVGIVTPISGESRKEIRSCLASVDCQTSSRWHHLVIMDDVLHSPAWADVNNYPHNENRTIRQIVNNGQYGVYARQWALGELLDEKYHCDYVCFLDGDNLIYPWYVERAIQMLDRRMVRTRPNEDVPDRMNPIPAFCIMPILHCGPLPAGMVAPMVLQGEPVVGKIDTLSVVSRLDILRSAGGWDCSDPYYSDGKTYERLAAYARSCGMVWVHPELVAPMGIHR